MVRFILMTAAFLMVLSGSAAPQETTSKDGLRAAIEDLRDGTLDDVAATPKVVKAFRKGQAKKRKLLRHVGPVENVAFWETFNGYDLYLVSFESGRVVYRMRLNDSGEIQALRYRVIVVVR